MHLSVSNSLHLTIMTRPTTLSVSCVCSLFDFGRIKSLINCSSQLIQHILLGSWRRLRKCASHSQGSEGVFFFYRALCLAGFSLDSRCLLATPTDVSITRPASLTRQLATCASVREFCKPTICIRADLPLRLLWKPQQRPRLG